MSLRIVVLYATTEGQTEKVAHHVVGHLTRSGVEAHAVEVDDPEPGFHALAEADAVILAASVHVGQHQKSFRDFVKTFRDMLDHRHTLFLPVSLTAAHVLPTDAVELAKIEANFESETGWHPEVVAPVAGALAYTRYGFFKRWMMWVLARTTQGPNGGLPLDTSRDWEFTDWEALDEVVSRFLARVRADEEAA